MNSLNSVLIEGTLTENPIRDDLKQGGGEGFFHR